MPSYILRMTLLLLLLPMPYQQCTYCNTGFCNASNGDCSSCWTNYISCYSDQSFINMCMYPRTSSYSIKVQYNCNLIANCNACVQVHCLGKCTGCQPGFQLVGDTCLGCTSPCDTCSGSATHCDSCVDSVNMYLSSNNECLCNPGKYLSGSTCLPCTPPCANCSGSATQCQSCVETSMQVVSQECRCTSSSEYMNGSTCSPCNSPCTTCTGATTCTGCISGRYLSGSSCLSCTSPCTSCTGTATTCLGCIGGKYLSGNICYDCSPPCANCVTNNTTCQSCMDSSNMTFSPNTCTCTNNTKYFNGTVCQSCTYPCLRCITSDTHCTECVAEYYLVGSLCNPCTPPCSNCLLTSTHCSTCKDSTHMTNASNICTCSQSNYFFNFTTNTCQICTSPCKTCVTSASNCTTCIDGNYLNGNLCPLCDPPCQKCVTTSSTCTYCMDNTNMQLLTNQCSCTNPQYYFDESESICKPCSLPCYSCVTSAVHCLTCMDQPHQTINASFECICNDINAFFNGLICLSCTLPCYTCLNTATYCLSCLDVLQDNSTNKCLCPDGYFEDSTHYCSLCQPPCVNCVTLNQCISCINGRYIHGFDCLQCVEPCNECEFATLCLNCIDSFMIVNQEQKCICHDGYFMSGISCFPCQSPCLNCENYPNQCTSCLQNFNLENETCVCQEYTYLQIYPENICLRCQLPCLECELAVDYCDLCSDAHHNLINHKCICSYGYGTSGIMNESCDLCIYPCATCSISINYCQSCMDGGFQLVDGQCICQDGYYEQNQQCWKCKNQCKRCINTADNCLECSDLNFILSQGKCQCKYLGYLEIVGECKKCHAPCLNCFAQVDLCTSCIKPDQLVVNYECVCFDSYYMDQNQDCQHCPLECATCLKKYICLSCTEGYYLENYKCVKCFEPCQQCTNMYSCINCVDEYYAFEDKCLGCPHKCKTCVDSYTCEFCSDGYYLLNNQCLQCSDECGTCIDSYYNCTACIDVNQIVIEGKCICKEKYFEEENSCKQCPSLCLQCTSYYYCQQCIIGAEIILEDNQCRCQIEYFLTDQNECIECSSKCKSCVLDANHCQSCSAQRELSDEKCICKNGYYESDDGECEDCNSEIGHLIEICQYENSIDGIWTWGEQCDDGNQILRDGCSNNQIDSDFKCLNVLSQQSYCVEGPEHCQTWEIIEIGKIDCSECQQGYYMYYEPNNPQNKICVKCSDRCLECKNSSINCTQCRFISINDQCRLCEQMKGYYSNYQTNTCYSTCGDSILADNEECDDGNLLDQDGCNRNCKIENTFQCQNSECSKDKNKASISVEYLNSTTTNQFHIILVGITDPECEFINMSIEQLDQKDYQFDTKKFQNNSTHLICSLQLLLFKSILKSNLIKFIYTSTPSTRILTEVIAEVTIIPRQQRYYDETQMEQSKQVGMAQEMLSQTVFILGPSSILLGGFDIFWNILDILSWLNNLYFINVDYPQNAKIFFQQCEWADLQLIPNLYELESPTESPPRFMEKDIGPVFLNNVGMLVSIVGCTLIGFIISLVVQKVIKCLITKFFIKRIKISKSPMIFKLNDQHQKKLFVNQRKPEIQNIYKQIDETPQFFKYLLKKSTLFRERFFSNIISTINLSMLDIVLAICLQLTYSHQNLLNFSFTIFGILICVLILIISKQQLNRHHQLLNNAQYKQLYGTFYENIDTKSRLALQYQYLSLLKKIMFTICLVIFYDKPILQTMLCCLSQFITILILITNNPFKDKQKYIQDGVPDICLFLMLLITVLLALDDIILLLSEEDRFLVGWILIAIIGCSISIQLFFLIKELLLDIYHKIRYVYDKIRKCC